MDGKITRTAIANRLRISAGALSDILNGKQPPGKRIANKFGEFTGRNWTDFLIMDPTGIEVELKRAMRNHGA